MMSSDSMQLARSVLSDVVLQKSKCPLNIKTELKSSIEKSLESTMDRLVQLLTTQFETGLTTTVMEIDAKISHMDDYLTTCSRQRLLRLIPSQETQPGESVIIL